jgi:ADP-ribosylglycohydrolase
MRAAPLGLLFGRDIGSMTTATVEQSRMTHLDPRCSAGALAVAGAVSLASAGGPIRSEEFLGTIAELTAPIDASFTEAVRRLQDWAHVPPAEAARHLHAQRLDPGHAGEWQGISAFVTPSVVWSLYAFLHAPEDYWATVCTAIAVGGDTDTMAAIAGAISGARLGPGALPAELVGRLNDRGGWGRDPLTELARGAARLVEA